MSWNPEQYERFRAERELPFLDLAALVTRRPRMRIVDLGCGTGELTQKLHRDLAARETLGIDSSAAMLAKAQAFATDGLLFRQAEIQSFAWAPPGVDLVFSNAALQWVPDNLAVLDRATRALAPSGQIAIQVPANDDHPSHAAAMAVAREEPFRAALGGFERQSHILSIDAYAAALDRLGYVSQSVRLQIYAHHLASRDEVIEWVKGTLLVAYQERLGGDDLYARFLDRYRERLFAELPDAKPFFYPFKRILLWGEQPAH